MPYPRSSAPSAVKNPGQPISRIASLAQRSLAAFPECALSWGWIVAWAREQLGLQGRWSREARAIDDPLERDLPLIEQALANDPPEVRRRILADLRQVHHRSETLASELAAPASCLTSARLL